MSLSGYIKLAGKSLYAMAESTAQLAIISPLNWRSKSHKVLYASSHDKWEVFFCLECTPVMSRHAIVAKCDNCAALRFTKKNSKK